MSDNVTPLRGSPLLTDIPGQLRQMADMIENGEVDASFALFVVPQQGDWPMIFGWGQPLGEYGNIGVLELAKAYFVNNQTERG